MQCERKSAFLVTSWYEKTHSPTYQLVVMCTTRGERRLSFKLKSVCRTLTVSRLKKGRASLVINCSCGYTFRSRFESVLILCCDSLRIDSNFRIWTNLKIV